MARRRKSGLTINHERWLVSYADFITLLFAFFVVMYSVSQISESKYRVLSDTLVSTFKFQSQTLNPIQVGQPSLSSDPSVIENSVPKQGESLGNGAFEKQTDLPHLAESLNRALADLIERNLVTVNSNEFWLEIELNSNVLFSSASATPNTDAKLIFAEVAKHLREADNPVQVEGYTDDNPIQTPSFPSNWELSAARASAVVKLLAADGVAPQRLSAVGYGEFQPIADNSTEAGRAQNRRVVLMIARTKPERPIRTLTDNVGAIIDEGLFKQATVKNVAVESGGNVGEDIVFSDDPSEPWVLPDLSGEEGNKEGNKQGNTMGDKVNSPESELTVPTVKGLRAIKLENGGMLFTSDPARQEQEKE